MTTIQQLLDELGTTNLDELGTTNLDELGTTNLDEALTQIIKLKLGYQPWRDRQTEILSKSTLTDTDWQELAEIEKKLMLIGWRASLGHSHEDVQAMKIIRKAARLIEGESCH